MYASRTRNAVRAVSPVPVPHSPGPGRLSMQDNWQILLARKAV